MGYAPEHCVVVEDSAVGLAAAAAAGMRVLHYAPHAFVGTSDTNTFSSMSTLPALLRSLERRA